MSRDLREPDTPSSTLSYFVREALRRIWVTRRTSFVAVAMIAMSLFIVGGFVLVADNLEKAVERWQGKSHVKVFFGVDATPDQIRAVDAYLASHAELRTRQFVTSQQALARFKTYFVNLSQVVDQLDENPFPPSFEVEVTPRVVQSPAFNGEMKALRSMSGVEQVQFDWEWLNRLRRLIDIINAVGLTAGGILAIAAAFTIANVIRLTMLTYREEIEIMRLVGATERIIRGPFIIEGILQGIIGGVAAIALLFGVFIIGQRLLAPSNSLLWSFLFIGFLPWQKMAAIVFGGMLAGWIGSWMSVRERVAEEV